MGRVRAHDYGRAVLRDRGGGGPAGGRGRQGWGRWVLHWHVWTQIMGMGWNSSLTQLTAQFLPTASDRLQVVVNLQGRDGVVL